MSQENKEFSRALIILGIFTICLLTWHTFLRPSEPTTPQLPSPTQFQEMVNAVLEQAGKPLIKVDGRIGKQTIQGYYDAYCWQSGVNSMKGVKP